MTTIADITFTEVIDCDILAYLVEHFDELGLGDADAKTNATKYLQASRDGCVEVRYCQAAGGRWYAINGLSLQSMNRRLRHTLCDGKYQDIDVVNAEPTIIQHLCRQNEFDCPRLDEYVKNREVLLETLGCSRDEAKDIYLAVMNGGSCDTAPNQTTHLKAFKKEMDALGQLFQERFPKLFRQVKARRVAKGKLTNHTGALVSAVFQQVENNILECMFEFFGRCSNCVLCFDGIMIPSDMKCDLEACQKYILKALSIRVELKMKPMDQCLKLSDLGRANNNIHAKAVTLEPSDAPTAACSEEDDSFDDDFDPSHFALADEMELAAKPRVGSDQDSLDNDACDLALVDLTDDANTAGNSPADRHASELASSLTTSRVGVQQQARLGESVNIRACVLPDTMVVTNESVGRHFLRCCQDRLMYNPELPQKCKLCYYEPSDKTWQTSEDRVFAWLHGELSRNVQSDFQAYVDKEAAGSAGNVAKCVRAARRELLRFQDQAFLAATFKWICCTVANQNSLVKRVQFNVEDCTKHYVQFQNCAFNLKTGRAEPRTRQMYITEYLDFDYSDSRDEAKIQEIMSEMKLIHQDPKFLDGFLAWRGYCLTGETSAKCFVLNVGYSGDNAKSTLSLQFEKAFPIYCTRIGDDTFDEHGGNFDKTMSKLLHQPYRLVFMEEWGSKSICTNRLKATTSGCVIPVKPMRCKEVNMKHTFKLEASSNGDPNLGTLDNGVNSRGRLFPYTSKFVTNDNEVDVSKKIYKANPNFLDRYTNPAYRLSLFQIIAPFSKQFYDKHLVLPDECKSGFADTAADTDRWTSFFEECVTLNPGEMVWKDDLLDAAKAHFKDPVKWTELLAQVKKQSGVEWLAKKDVQRRGRKMRGWIKGMNVTWNMSEQDAKRVRL